MKPGSPCPKNSVVPMEYPSRGSLSQTPTSFGQLSDTSIKQFCQNYRYKRNYNKIKCNKDSNSLITFGDFKIGEIDQIVSKIKKESKPVEVFKTLKFIPNSISKPISLQSGSNPFSLLKDEVSDHQLKSSFRTNNIKKKVDFTVCKSSSNTSHETNSNINIKYKGKGQNIVKISNEIATDTIDLVVGEHEQPEELIQPVLVVPLEPADPFIEVILYLTKELLRVYSYHELITGTYDSQVKYLEVSKLIDLENILFQDFVRYIRLIKLPWLEFINHKFYDHFKNNFFFKISKPNIQDLLVVTINGGVNPTCYRKDYKNKQINYPKIVIDKYISKASFLQSTLNADIMIIVLRNILELDSDINYGPWFNKYIYNGGSNVSIQTDSYTSDNCNEIGIDCKIPTKHINLQKQQIDMDVQCDLGPEPHQYKANRKNTHKIGIDIPDRKEHRFYKSKHYIEKARELQKSLERKQRSLLSTPRELLDLQREIDDCISKSKINIDTELLYTLKTKYFMASRSPVIIGQMVMDARSFISKNELKYDREVYTCITNTIMQAYILDEQELVFRSMMKNNTVLDGVAHLNDTMAGNLGKSFRGFHKNSLIGNFLGNKSFPKVSPPSI